MSSQERKLFGTDGVRGTANEYPMTCEVALALGRAVAFQAQAGDHRHKIIIGKDTRLSGYMVEMAFASGVCSMGVDALLIGPLPTPAIAFLTHDMRADAGVMISASHNPYEDNGIKIFARDGFKLPDAKEAELERLMKDQGVEKVRPTKDDVGKAFRIDDASGRYIGHLKSAFPSALDLTGLTAVVDCANGAAYNVAPTVLEELGAVVHRVGVSPNGRNINDDCGALHPKRLQAAVREHHADIGIALDGDADRLVVVDENAEIVDGDCILALGAEALIEQGVLRRNTLVTTVMSNAGLERRMHELGGHVVRTQVGDRYVVDEMRRSHYVFGGEQSGHLVYLTHSTTGDGMLAALQLLAMMKRRGAKLSELSSTFESLPQAQRSVVVREKRPLEEFESVQGAITSAETQLGSDGRVLVRYSGTEKKARVLVEGVDASLVEESADKIAQEIRNVLAGD